MSWTPSRRSRSWLSALALIILGCGQALAARVPPPPWPRPFDTPRLVRAAGLELMPMEGIAYHIHALLRVWYQGQAVTVPANIGIDTGGYSSLHTHDTTGIVHVEAPLPQDFTLGQFFTEWGVPLTGARGLVNGRPVSDPAGIVLRDGQVIDVVFD